MALSRLVLLFVIVCLIVSVAGKKKDKDKNKNNDNDNDEVDSEPPASAPIPAAPGHSCGFCLSWAAEVISEIPINSSSKVVDRVLERSCDRYVTNSSALALCKLYVDRIAQSSVVTEDDQILKQTRHTVRQLSIGSTPWLLCTNMRQCSCCETENPEQVHLAIYNPTTYSVMWTTSAPVAGFVKWWNIASPQLVNILPSTTSTFTDGGWVGYLHLAFITNLTTNKYTYAVGNENAWSRDFTFTFVSPSISSPIRFAFVADMGVDRCSDNTVNSLIQEANKESPVQFIYHGGDMVYSVEDSYLFDLFNRKIEPFTSVVPYMVAVGNHEKFFDYVNYLKRYHMPYNNSGSESNLWYSWNWGPVHFVTYSTQHDIVVGSPQYEWLIADLQSNAANRNERPWLIAIGHHMTYCSTDSSRCDSYSRKIRKQVEPIFHEYKVDLVLNGHAHSYERMYPVYKNKPLASYDSPTEPVYINNGCGGAHASSVSYCGFDHIWQRQPNWSAVRITAPAYAIVDVSRTEATYQLIGSNDGLVLDSVTVRK